MTSTRPSTLSSTADMLVHLVLSPYGIEEKVVDRSILRRNIGVNIELAKQAEIYATRGTSLLPATYSSAIELLQKSNPKQASEYAERGNPLIKKAQELEQKLVALSKTHAQLVNEKGAAFDTYYRAPSKEEAFKNIRVMNKIQEVEGKIDSTTQDILNILDSLKLVLALLSPLLMSVLGDIPPSTARDKIAASLSYIDEFFADPVKKATSLLSIKTNESKQQAKLEAPQVNKEPGAGKKEPLSKPLSNK